MDQVSYVGKWTAFGRAVFVEQANLSRPLMHGDAEPACGFGWRRQDSATTITVARALLLDATGDEAIARRLGARFAAAVVADLPPAGFRLTRRRILDWVADISLDRFPHLRLIQGGGYEPNRPGPRRGSPSPHPTVADPSHRAA